MGEEATPALVEIRQSQLEPGTTGQHTNGCAPFWLRVNGGQWRRVGGYRTSYRLVRDLEELLEAEPKPEPPRWLCPKCGGETWEIFGHDRACHDSACGGMIPLHEVWGAVDQGGER